jgi:hypothetical protein
VPSPFEPAVGVQPPHGETAAPEPTLTDEQRQQSELEAIEVAMKAAAGEEVPAAEPDPTPLVSDEPPADPPVTPPVDTPVDTPPADPVTPPAEPAATPPVDPAADPVKTEMDTLGVKNERARERFQALTADSARLREREPVAQRWERLETHMHDAGITPTDFGNAMNVLKMVKSNDPAMLNAAYEGLLTELTAVAKRIGREVPGQFDPLSDPRNHDLNTRVAADEIDRPSALELARSRHTTALIDQNRQSQAEATRQANERTAAVNQAVLDLNSFGTQQAGADPLYQAKMDALAPVIKVLRETTPPHEWLPRLKDAYLQVRVAAPAAAPPAPPAPPPLSSQPLRPTGNSSNGLAREAASDMDVVEMALRAAKGLNY